MELADIFYELARAAKNDDLVRVAKLADQADAAIKDRIQTEVQRALTTAAVS